MTNPNPFAQQQPQQAAPASDNPFGAGVPQQSPAPAAPPAAPQAYAQPQQPPAAPQYGSPYGVAPGAQHAPAVYGGPQQPAAPQYAAQAAASPPAALDPNALNAAAPPPPSGDGKGPKLADMYGRLVLIFPHAITRRPRNPQYITQEMRQRGDLDQDQVTATVVVLDSGPGTPPGGTIDFGGAPYSLPPVPHTDRAPLPYVRKAMWITQSRVIAQLRDFLPQPGGVPGMVAGRFAKTGPAQNDPWYIEGAKPEEIALCQTYLQLVASGQYPHPLA